TRFPFVARLNGYRATFRLGRHLSTRPVSQATNLPDRAARAPDPAIDDAQNGAIEPRGDSPAASLQASSTTRDHTRQRLHVTSEVRLLAERLDRRVVGVVPKPDGVIAIDDPQADDVRALIDSTARSWVWHQEAVLAGSTAQERAGPRPR